MKRSLRILCLALAVLLCGGILAACDSEPATGNTSAPSEGNTSGTESESLAGEFTDEKGNYIDNNYILAIAYYFLVKYCNKKAP